MHGRPKVFYDRLATCEIAESFGATNFLHGRASNGCVEASIDTLKLENPAPPGEVTLTIRSEAVRLENGENSFAARVRGATYLGTLVLYSLDASGAALKAALPPHVRLTVGAIILPTGRDSRRAGRSPRRPDR